MQYFMGFHVTDIARLRILLDAQAWTFDQAMTKLEHAAGEREWREHFGILCDLFEPEDDTPYIKCARCYFKVVLPWHSTDATMRCTDKGHEIFVGYERLKPIDGYEMLR